MFIFNVYISIFRFSHWCSFRAILCKISEPVHFFDDIEGYGVNAAMFRAQFAFKSSEAGVLPSAVGDQFTVIDSSNEQWWLVQNGNGQIGYVPANYIVADDVRRKII